MGRNWGGRLSALFEGEELGLHLAQCGVDQAHLRAMWHLDAYRRLARMDMG